MDVDVWVRRAALAAVPLIGLAIYLLRSDPPPDEPAPAASASASAPGAVHDGLPEARPTAPSASELGRRGEAALAQRPAEPPPPAPARERPRALRPKSRAAADLPLADDSELHGRSAAPRGNAPSGPCGGIEARLITVSDDPDWTFASLAPPGDPAAIRHVGDRVGRWRVDGIEWDRVWLRAGGTRCAVGMHVGARAAAADVGGTPDHALLDDAPDRPARWHVPREIENAIEKLGDSRYAVDRAIVPALYERAGNLLAGIRLTPLKSDERVTGIALGEVRPESLLDRFGVANGDVVLEINGEATTTLAATLRGFDKARKAERLSALLERTGQRYQLEVIAR